MQDHSAALSDWMGGGSGVRGVAVNYTPGPGAARKSRGPGRTEVHDS